MHWRALPPSQQNAVAIVTRREPHGWRSGQGRILSDRNHPQAARATGGAELLHADTLQVNDLADAYALSSTQQNALNIATTSEPHGWRSGQGCIVGDRNHPQGAGATGGAGLVQHWPNLTRLAPRPNSI